MDRKFADAIYSTFGADLTPLTERYSKNLFAKQRPVASSTLIENKIKAALINFSGRAFETFVDFGHFSVFYDIFDVIVSYDKNYVRSYASDMSKPYVLSTSGRIY